MTFTRLTLGEPRLRGKASGGTAEEACTEDITYGTNILKDPGFEQHLGNTAASSWSDSIPTDATSTAQTPESGLLWVDEGEFDDSLWTPVTNTASGWFHPFFSNEAEADYFWIVSTANPRSGTHHARFTKHASTASSPDFAPYVQGRCSTPFNPYSTRIAPGDFIELTFWSTISTTTNSPTAHAFFAFFDSSFAGAGTDIGTDSALSTSYTSFSHSSIAPAGAYYAYAMLQISFMGAGAIVDIDDVTLELQP